MFLDSNSDKPSHKNATRRPTLQVVRQITLVTIFLNYYNVFIRIQIVIYFHDIRMVQTSMNLNLLLN